MPGILGNKSITLTAFRNQRELSKLPAPSEKWRWSEFVGKAMWKCDASPATRMRNAGHISKQDDGRFTVSEDLAEYLAQHGVELDAWRTDIIDTAAVYAGSQRVAERREESCECVECNATFDTAYESRAHYARSHGHVSGEKDGERRGEQTQLTQFESIGKCLRTEQGGGQAKLVV